MFNYCISDVDLTENQDLEIRHNNSIRNRFVVKCVEVYETAMSLTNNKGSTGSALRGFQVIGYTQQWNPS